MSRTMLDDAMMILSARNNMELEPKEQTVKNILVPVNKRPVGQKGLEWDLKARHLGTQARFEQGEYVLWLHSGKYHKAKVRAVRGFVDEMQIKYCLRCMETGNMECKFEHEVVLLPFTTEDWGRLQSDDFPKEENPQRSDCPFPVSLGPHQATGAARTDGISQARNEEAGPSVVHGAVGAVPLEPNLEPEEVEVVIEIID